MTTFDTTPDTRIDVASLQPAEVTRSLERMRRRYPDAASLEEVQKMLDEALGETSLTEEVYRMRAG